MEHPFLAGFPVIVRLPIQWGEMDAYGHVNNAMYFRFFESARIAYLEQCGFTRSYEEDRVGAILHSTDCRFRRALTYPDTILVGSRTIDIQEDRFTMAYTVVSLEQEAVAAQGTGLIVSFDYTKREKTALPEPVRTGILNLEHQD